MTEPLTNNLDVQHELKAPDTISGIPFDKLIENVRATMARGLPEFVHAPLPNRAAAVIVTGGPSAHMMAQKIRELAAAGATVFAVKAVWRWLMNLGVTPDYCVMIDPHPSQAAYVVGAPKEMKWLIASQCDPAVFDQLKAQNADVTVFHVPLKGADNPGLSLPDGSLDRGKQLVPGGGGVGSRTVRIAAVMGHVPLHLFGFDCCYQNGSSASPQRIADGAVPSHLYQLARGQDVIGPVSMNGRVYLSTWCFLTETIDIMQLCISGLTPQMHIHGSGMLTDTIREVMAQNRKAAAARVGPMGETFGGAPKGFELPEASGLDTEFLGLGSDAYSTQEFYREMDRAGL